VSVELPLGELQVINAAVLWKCLLAVQLCTHSSPCALPRVLIMANKSWFLDAPVRRLGDRIVGTGSPVYITAEIGINHNGDLATAVALIDQAAEAGCDAIKFQKRTPEICIPRDQWEIERDTPWGRMSYIDYRHRVEFDIEAYTAIDEHAKRRGIAWFASPWDVESVDFLEAFDVPAHKVASACLTDDELLRRLRATGRTIILSTGMSTMRQIRHAVEVLGSDNIILCHATSTYPAPAAELNLKMIHTLQAEFPNVPIGYSVAGALAQLIESPHEIDVDAVITDFDGVHTDDSAAVSEDGRESVRVSRADGLGVERLRSVGVPMLIVSKEVNRVVQARAAKLGVEVRYGVDNKRQVVAEWLAAHQIPGDRAAYLGNDVNALGPMGLVGWPVAVADAHPAVRQAARILLSRAGGHGAVRELCDLVVEHRLRAATEAVVTSFSGSD
jgi:YrbI family 3-deoxy-D-manno-octulosonate 8-phosphate phosphatase